MREMKDSGVEWIGNIPAKWEIRRIKTLPDCNVQDSFVDGDWIESPYITDEGIRYLTTGNVGDGKYKEQGSGYISEETFTKLNCKFAYPGDYVISRLNAPYGRSCILPDTKDRYVLAVDVVILRTNALHRIKKKFHIAAVLFVAQDRYDTTSCPVCVHSPVSAPASGGDRHFGKDFCHFLRGAAVDQCCIHPFF